MSVVVFCFSLSACSYTVEQLIDNEPLRVRLIKKCLSQGIDAKDDSNCRNATEAQLRVTGKKVLDMLP